MDLSKIKYYPDRFYVCLDGFDIDNLTSFLSDFNIGQQQAIFIHEYYHYLTNITTFPGVRQFQLNFCDRFRLITILTKKAGLDAYPISMNSIPDCKDDVDYWNRVTTIIDEDDIDNALVKETEISHNKKFEIESVEQIKQPMEMVIKGNKVSGDRILTKINISGLINIHSFILTYGAMDEFLSSAIDEYLFENDFSEIDPQLLSQRPFYPYGFFEKLLAYYGISRPSAFEKIIIVYYALNSFNPPLKLIQILEKLKAGDYEMFQQNPEKYLLEHFPERPNFDAIIEYIDAFAKQTYAQGRILISQALKYYHDKFLTAQKLREQDPFYFIRPFFEQGEDAARFKQRFLLSLGRIINLFSPPVILKDGVFWYVDKLTTFGEATTLIIATYEIFESLKNRRIAKRPSRLKAKYIFPDRDPDCDNIERFKPPPIWKVFHLALNELNLYAHYLVENESPLGFA